MRKIFLIDCPGVVPPNENETETDVILKGVVSSFPSISLLMLFK
jgi:ribosome biogenesis GTPase A